MCNNILVCYIYLLHCRPTIPYYIQSKQIKRINILDKNVINNRISNRIFFFFLFGGCSRAKALPPSFLFFDCYPYSFMKFHSKWMRGNDEWEERFFFSLFPPFSLLNNSKNPKEFQWAYTPWPGSCGRHNTTHVLLYTHHQWTLSGGISSTVQLEKVKKTFRWLWWSYLSE